MSEITPEVWASCPQVIRSRYRFLSCLSGEEHYAVMLCQTIATDKKVIIKASDSLEIADRLRKENQLLTMIHSRQDPRADLFPHVVELYHETENSFTVLIRDYVSGHSIESLVESRQDRPGLHREKSIQYLKEVLNLLSFLHHLDPVIIHRDIKPQNIIVDELDHCHLIDLDIARSPNDCKNAPDTFIIGTRLTAPPEQFGYQQTSIRSDIYSAGVLLLYCMTGSYYLSAAKELDPFLRRIVKHATNFDPNQRYASDEAMCRALGRASKFSFWNSR
ncbi:MAG: protein kinase [Clostridia bacterium]|nr:protein kinase [Clostridia bacterium]